MLGTGSAMVTNCYNTCFIVESGDSRLMVDGGGGNGILVQLQKANFSINDIRHLFVTHAHTDHILGSIWVIRLVMQKMLGGSYEGEFHVYGNDKVIDVISTVCRMTLHKRYSSLLNNRIVLHTLSDGDEFTVGDMLIKCFDILSTKEKQYGFTLRFGDGTRLVCMGDEPCNEATLHYAEDADWLMCEAFCLYADRDVFHPYEKHHSTALDAGRVAKEARAENLLIYHTEDTDLPRRKEKYSAEIGECFDGRVVVPDDLESIDL